jgi:hypothetical protein
METASVLRSARSRSSAMTSGSVAAGGRSSVPCHRITSGMAASISSSIEL